MAKQRIQEVMNKSGVKFGTSGARGLAQHLTDEVAYIYTTAFLQHLFDKGLVSKRSFVCVSGDLRPSTDRIIAAISTAIEDFGAKTIHAGKVPSPALALFGFTRGLPTVMVTGSHIPSDRNGIKFTLPEGEMMKEDEEGMKEQSVSTQGSRFNSDGGLVVPVGVRETDTVVATDYHKRYLDVFPKTLLQGKKIGVYQHSAVGRDLILEILKSLGATVTAIGRSETFVPVDTEAIRQEDRDFARKSAKEFGFDAIVSTDGDSDRPLVADETGAWLRGDVAGVLVAKYLRAEGVVTPVSCNSMVDSCGFFDKVVRTRIGSPYVIQGMKDLKSELKKIVGYEANGGFLLGTPVEVHSKTLSALPTRDAVIVFLSILASSVETQNSVAELVAELPKRYTASDRLTNFPTEKSLSIIEPMLHEALSGDYSLIEQHLGLNQSTVTDINVTDGLRITLSSNEIVHIRPSGNAPELRCYTEAESEERSQELLKESLARMKKW